MLVKRISDFSGVLHEMDLPITDAQIQLYKEGKELIQNCFPQLTPEQRDFIKFGCTPEEWTEYIGDEEY